MIGALETAAAVSALAAAVAVLVRRRQRRCETAAAGVWAVERVHGYSARPWYVVSGDPVTELVRGVVYSLAESDQDNTRCVAWQDLVVALSNLRAAQEWGAEAVELPDLEHEVDRAWDDLAAELPAALSINPYDAARLAALLTGDTP